ncbi:hypothetical protein EYF80_012646 [Liparis tanakae]|uniref:Uncharacterized protein n=1 Tax=Liparis tanakae TaxID=230148 RepID=A0A4Z2IH98_9TELE|nr:hypothetical protein EYF80_012646 [Liparis tanakae]
MSGLQILFDGTRMNSIPSNSTGIHCSFCEMETSNLTVTGSETFSTGRMNWLYLLNSFLKSRSSALDEKQSGRAERGGANRVWSVTR